MNRRKRNRGECGWDTLDFIVLVIIAVLLSGLVTSIEQATGQLKRIADFTCIEAPVAEPAEAPEGE